MLFPGLSEIRRASNGQEFPNARDIGNIFDKTEDFKTCGYTLASVHLMFSQMIAHDLTRRRRVEKNNSNGIKCCTDTYSGPLPPNETNPVCIPVSFPKNDAFYADKGVFCQSFVRMQTTLEPNCKITYAPVNTKLETHLKIQWLRMNLRHHFEEKSSIYFLLFDLN